MIDVFLDNNATTPLDPRVFEAMEPWLRREHGNPSSVHRHGRRARAAIHAARRTIADALRAHEEEIVLAAGGTGADNLAITGMARALRRAAESPDRAASRTRSEDGPVAVITTVIEHEAVLEPVAALERDGFATRFLPVDERGFVDPNAVASAIESARPARAIVSVMAGNNEIGSIQPLEAIARITSAHGALFHSDMVQALGKVDVDLSRTRVDAAAFSAHKIHGPKGVGALFLRRGTPFEPIFSGGGQESSIRPGTENVAGIIGFARAVELAMEEGSTGRERTRRRTRALLDRLRREVPGLVVNGPGPLPEIGLPNTLDLSFEGVRGETLVIALDLEGVSVSAGSACSSGALEASHVVRAITGDPGRIEGAIRVSLSRMNEDEEIERFASVLARCIGRIRAVPRNPTTDGPASERLE